MEIEDILNTLIGTLVGAGLALCSSFYLYKHKNNVTAEGSATILYNDIEDSIEAINIARAYSQLEDQSVVDNRLSRLVDKDNFRDLIIDLRNKLSSKHIKKLLAYYNDLELLEHHRVEYWSTKALNNQYEIYRAYKSMLDEIYDQSTQQEFTDAFKEVKKCSAFKNDN